MSGFSRALRRWPVRIFLVVVLLVVVIGVATSATVATLFQVLTPPVLPETSKVTEQVWGGDQNWSAEDSDRFHFESQGTRTLPVPLKWFLALEQPLGSPLSIPFGERGRFADPGYLTRFGFIKADTGKYNPNGLPIGFAVAPYQSIEGLSAKQTAIGLTCAACHTGQLVFGGKRYVIDGGPAQTDLGQLTLALGAALGQTALSEKLPLLGGRFERFAKAVLGSEYNAQTRGQLAKDLDAVIGRLATQPGGVDVTEGFARLDALNRIGNQVFALDTHRYDNYVNINAPVSYPHIWTSSWFDWVQYDGSIMQPLVRNAGEALGVTAELDLNAPPGAGRFSSSINFDSLHWIEATLRGPKEPAAVKAFTGLNAPGWPRAFPAIDPAKAARGAQLYDKICSGCHLPALTPDIAHGKAPDAPFWANLQPVRWWENGAERATKESLLRLNIIPQDHVGTDPAQGQVLAKRQVNTAGTALAKAGDFSPGVGLDTQICIPGRKTEGAVYSPGTSPTGANAAVASAYPDEHHIDGLQVTHVADDAALPFPWALGAIVNMSIDQWLRLSKKDAEDRADIQGDRPNCLLAGAGYKARPLNGVWATAPFLHNGSVPTIYDLLSPAAERPKAFLIGDPSFDPVRVGLVTHPADPKDGQYDGDGYFILDTSKPGNRNTGHEFSNDNRPGVIGPALSPEDRFAIIEFLKGI
jgi:mono/diheme cytochrome c family protein